MCLRTPFHFSFQDLDNFWVMSDKKLFERNLKMAEQVDELENSNFDDEMFSWM